MEVRSIDDMVLSHFLINVSMRLQYAVPLDQVDRSNYTKGRRIKQIYCFQNPLKALIEW